MIGSPSVSHSLVMQVFESKKSVGRQWVRKGIQPLIFHDEVKIAKCRPKDLKGTYLQRSLTCGENPLSCGRRAPSFS
jgi:hypothetical protein